MTGEMDEMNEMTVGEWQKALQIIAETDRLTAAVLSECGLVFVGAEDMVLCYAPGSFASQMFGEHEGLMSAAYDRVMDTTGRSVTFVNAEPSPSRPSLVIIAAMSIDGHN